ncbi:IS5 family transposase [Rubritalea spongiae]|uniref:IS5 family transposase n=1 Tax=Rubritalea spongiae TaxID=430797 RepID=UPI0036207631
MRPPKHSNQPETAHLFQPLLIDILDPTHELVVLAAKIDWDWLDGQLCELYSTTGRAAIPTRLMVGLHLLKHAKALSDEEVCRQWKENPYFQLFCGEKYFQHRFPIERSSMTHWRKRIGDKKLETLISELLRVAHQTGALDIESLSKVIVDTTVQPKNVTHPTDAKLALRGLTELVKMAKLHGIKLRQSYAKEAKRLAIMAGRYAHAKQFKRMRKTLKKLKGRLGRVERDIARKINGNAGLEETFRLPFYKAFLIRTQKPRDKVKIYSWHAPEVECIAKGKAHKPYEFGIKVSVITPMERSAGGLFVLHSEAIEGRPYDGHTLNRVIQATRAISGIKPERIYVDKGYVGHDYPDKRAVFRSGQIRGVTPEIKRELRRRSAVEPVIGHMKTDGHLGRNYLHGKDGDKINAVLCGAGHNMRLLLKWFATFLLKILSTIFPQKSSSHRPELQCA